MFSPWQRAAVIGTRRIGGNYAVRLTNPIAKSEQRPLLCRPHLSSPNEADSLAPVIALLVWTACVGRPRSGMVRPDVAHIL